MTTDAMSAPTVDKLLGVDSHHPDSSERRLAGNGYVASMAERSDCPAQPLFPREPVLPPDVGMA